MTRHQALQVLQQQLQRENMLTLASAKQEPRVHQQNRCMLWDLLSVAGNLWWLSSFPHGWVLTMLWIIRQKLIGGALLWQPSPVQTETDRNLPGMFTHPGVVSLCLQLCNLLLLLQELLPVDVHLLRQSSKLLQREHRVCWMHDKKHNYSL